MTGWRPALRIAWRDALRHRGRSILVLVMISLPVLAVSAAAVDHQDRRRQRARGGRAPPRRGRRPHPDRGPRPDRAGARPQPGRVGAAGRDRLRRPASPRTTYARVLGADARLAPPRHRLVPGPARRPRHRLLDDRRRPVRPARRGALRPRDRAPARGGRRGRRQRRDARQGLRRRRRARGQRLHAPHRRVRAATPRPATTRSCSAPSTTSPSDATNVREWLVEAGPVSWSQVRDAQPGRRPRHLAGRAGRPAGRRVDGRADGLRHRQRRAPRRRHPDHRDGADRGRPAGRSGLRRRCAPPRPDARADRRLGRHAGAVAPRDPRQRCRARPGRLGARAGARHRRRVGPAARWSSASRGSGSARSSCPGSTSSRSSAFGLVSAVLASVVPAWLASRQDVVAVLAGRRGDRRPRASTPVVGLVLLGVGIATSAYGAVTSDSGNGALWIAASADRVGARHDPGRPGRGVRGGARLGSAAR